MKKFFGLTLVAMLFIGAVMPVMGGKMIVSIGEFKNKSNCDPAYFKSLIDRITNSIVNTRKFDVVDNARLKEIIIEQQKADSGISEVKGAPQGGKVKSAGYVIYGTVLSFVAYSKAIELNGVIGSKLTCTLELNVRFTDAETGELVASKIVKVEESEKRLNAVKFESRGNLGCAPIQRAVQVASEQVVDKLMELAFPTVILKVAGDQVYINLPEERARPDMLLHVFTKGEELTDPDTGESLGQSEALVGDLKVIRTFPKYAIAEPIPPLTAAKLVKGMNVRPVSSHELEKLKAETQTEEVKRFRKRF
jgi:curli biogenesis system outer membrane secretion channel CsgG